ncbi:U3 snoRNP protein [Exophiala xenobiotica]|uniref:U3 snoRNP protein n=1 Tax=Vermiconidia calcicola TaxID=1690605 RepID=A0AAV9QDC9_9PEZI|nr:U3 snoRNP protein [Exophiala xenobiotica]KAK5541145.1 U3 snoRNP protein [Vermiconidia calcicola]KAK5549362.1 U3 snoRNP protein [Chaetothyriales sp. CCFEE 6169]KAK5193989.1 U3 snoRNP protein [Exophiala xenobiotica]KAK5211698.1 U3 snoRNP protein [Exophiala xenobiotica]
MKTEFKFSNLLGTVYGRGNLVFTPDGNSLLSPVGNRISVFNLTKNTSYTLPFAHRKNITHLDLSPDGNLLLTIDEDGRAILSIFPRRLAIYHFSFKTQVTSLAFSPDGLHFVVGLGRKIQAWKTPSTPSGAANGDLEFAPFVLLREYGGHFDEVRHLSWSGDSRFFLSASKDLTARIWSLEPEEGFEPTVLSGHRQQVRNVWFSADQESIYTVSEDGALFRWEFAPRPQNEDEDQAEPTDERWRIVQREYFMQNAKLKCATYHPATNLLTVCFDNGLFSLYEIPSFSNIHSLSMASSPISTVTINKTGEWLAMGSSKTGQLLVWEHASESNILKQSSHLDALTALSYSPDSTRIITGADDGLIKIWDIASGFHIATFTEHASAVTASAYSKRGNILFTSSLDGSVRAWDMLRYRNFRTFTAPTRLSFSCLAIDPSAEVVCAASHDSFDIHLWSVQTGALLDQLSGHEGPISTLAFTPDGRYLVSGSWDHTIRVWSVFDRSQTSEVLQLTSDLLCVAIRPDSAQIAASTLDGSLTFWSLNTSIQESGLDGRRDVSGGRTLTSRRTAASTPGTKSFNTITYAADGTCLLAAGNSKYICLYSVTTLTLIKKYTVSINLSLDGTQEFLNSAAIMSNGLPRDMIDIEGEASDLDDRIDRSLPGVKRGKDATARTLRTEVRVTGIEFAPTGRSFCAASTEGLLIYSLDNTGMEDFDPFDLDIDVTPQNIRAILEQPEPEHLKALVMAFRLNDRPLLRKVYESVPYEAIPLLIRELPKVYLGRLLILLGQQMENSPHLEFALRWVGEVLSVHGRYIKERQGEFASELRAVLRGVDGVGRTIRTLSERNAFEIEFLCQQSPTEDQSALQLLGEKQHSLTNAFANGVDDDEGEWMGLD